MNRKKLCQLIWQTWDFKKLVEFENLIYHLNVIMFHTECEEQAEDIQKAIWFVQDQIKRLDIT